MIEQSQDKLLLVLTGPSGVGKDTILDRLALKTKLARVVTWTDRPPKPGEINGIHYHFISTPEFRNKIDQNEFLEWVEYGADPDRGLPGTLKGTTKNSLYPPQDQHLVWRIDPSRAANVRETFLQAFAPDQAMQLLARTLVIYLTVESEAELCQRQITRDGQIDQARLEHDRKVWQQYSTAFRNIIINRAGQQDNTVKEIISLISSPWAREV